MRLAVVMCWRGKKQVVLVLTSICSGASFGCLCIGVATSYWLYAVERVPNENGTIYLKATTTGLWRKCVENGWCYYDWLKYLPPQEEFFLRFRRYLPPKKHHAL